MILFAEPAAHLGIQKIRERAHARPNACLKVGAVRLFAEIALFRSLVIDGIADLLFDAGVDDRDQVNALRALVLHIFRKMRKRVCVDGKVLVGVHVVNIEIHAVQRNTYRVITADHVVHRLGVGVAPAALLIAERPLGRQIALADSGAEGADDLARLFPVYQIDGKILALDRDLCLVCGRIAQIPADARRKVDEQAKAFFAADDDKIMRRIERPLGLGVKGVVGAIALIDPAALVDAARRLAQAKDDILRRQLEPKAEAAVFECISKRKALDRLCGDSGCERVRLDRIAV